MQKKHVPNPKYRLLSHNDRWSVELLFAAVFNVIFWFYRSGLITSRSDASGRSYLTAFTSLMKFQNMTGMENECFRAAFLMRNFPLIQMAL